MKIEEYPSLDREWTLRCLSILLSDPSELLWTRDLKIVLYFAAWENVPDHHPVKLLNETLRLCHAWHEDQFRTSEFLRSAA